MAVYYICPSCKTKVDEHQKYCPGCGTWLLSTTFPAKRIDTKKRAGNVGGSVIALLVVAAVAYFGLFKPDAAPANVTFSEIKMENYIISQLIVDPKTPAASADFTPLTDSGDPVEVKAVFYDEAGSRLGVASALVTQLPAKDQTTTLSLQFDEVNELRNIREVRIEVQPLSPLMLLQRAADQMSKQN